jgi:hypothetical protein
MNMDDFGPGDAKGDSVNDFDDAVDFGSVGRFHFVLRLADTR